MLFSPRTPVIIGSAAMAVLVWILYAYSPMPGHLSHAHGVLGVETLELCVTCHAPEGLTAGCLSCHVEIAVQVNEKRGYHHYLARGGELACRDCHVEHLGSEMELVSAETWGAQVPRAFSHPHVEFQLSGKHELLECSECHVTHLKEPVSLPGFPRIEREQTYLGLSQDCVTCHEDPHAGGIAGDCGDCHDQDSFAPPAFFEHDDHFPLTGGHDDLVCRHCHEIPLLPVPFASRPFPFDKALGVACQDCHESPHRVEFDMDCVSCHQIDEPRWVAAQLKMTPELHASTGFPLDRPHDSVACVECHDPELPFAERHGDPADPDRARRPDTCERCHVDSHQGQFRGKYDHCLDCHQATSFRPSTFTHAQHEAHFPLVGSHAATPCIDCHTPNRDRTRVFVGTPASCLGCHGDPHAGQFQAQVLDQGCVACHGSDIESFTIRPFDHMAETGFQLRGAHAQVECSDCHLPSEFSVGEETVTVRRYVDTPDFCHGCHQDIHQGQLEAHGACESCHVSETSWQEIRFDHDTQSRFPLEGEHRQLPCASCHQPEPLTESEGFFIRYRPLGRECEDCHDTDPRGK